MTKIYTVSTNHFTYDEELGLYKAVFTADSIGFSGTKFYNVRKFLKNESGEYRNVIVSYEISLTGDLTIFSDVAMAGRLVLDTD